MTGFFMPAILNPVCQKRDGFFVPAILNPVCQKRDGFFVPAILNPVCQKRDAVFCARPHRHLPDSFFRCVSSAQRRLRLPGFAGHRGRLGGRYLCSPFLIMSGIKRCNQLPTHAVVLVFFLSPLPRYSSHSRVCYHALPLAVLLSCFPPNIKLKKSRQCPCTILLLRNLFKKNSS
jgi:hypothetical protein